jgi:hypothetical protein
MNELPRNDETMIQRHFFAGAARLSFLRMLVGFHKEMDDAIVYRPCPVFKLNQQSAKLNFHFWIWG